MKANIQQIHMMLGKKDYLDTVENLNDEQWEAYMDNDSELLDALTSYFWEHEQNQTKESK